jgi:predicted ATPase
MRRILVTGMSGTGKSSALAELARRGFRAIDTDEPGWTVEDADGGRSWDVQRIEELLGEEVLTLYVSGTVSNQGRFYDRFERSCSSALRRTSSSRGSRPARRTSTGNRPRSES